MRDSIILQLFHAEAGTYDYIKMTDKESAFLSTVVDMHEQLEKMLSPTQRALLDKLTDIRADLSCAAVESYYSEGFKTGLLIGIECIDR